ncbi:MAG: sensor histidine kinase [Methylococcales bacterium]|nr:sensor histidine kinase [Methylococcales bacterium]
MLKLLILFFLQVGITNAFAEDNVLDVSKFNQDAVSLTQYFAVLEDPTTTLTFTDLQLPENSTRFKTHLPPDETLNYGFSSAAYWLRLPLKNSSDKPVERMLEISDAILSNVDFYTPNFDGTYSSIQTGLRLPFSTRPYKNRYFVFPIVLPANSTQLFYLRIRSITSTRIPTKLWTTQDFRIHERNDYQIQALYFGMATTMLLFNLLLFLLLRDAIYLRYINSCFFIALTVSAQNGLFKEFLFPDSTFWIDKTMPMLGAGLVITFLFFMRSMLNTKIVTPIIDRVIKMFIAFYLLIIFALITVPLQMPVIPIATIYLLTPPLFFIICLTCVLKKQRNAYIFSFAFFVFVVGTATHMLKNFTALPTNIFTTNSVQIGSAIEMILMAIALADRYKTIRLEKENMQQLLVETLKSSEQILESKVLERTNELETARQQLELLVEKKRQHSIEKSHFLAMLTHELKSPIATIEFAAQNIERTQDAQINELSLKHIQAAAHDMSIITERCLQADKLEQAALSPTNITTFSFDMLLYDRRFQGLWLKPENATRLQFDISEQISITSDVLLCQIIMSNLLENALKYSPAKSVVLISANYNAQQSVLLISVFNEVGKAGKPDAEKIFEKYYRSRNAQRFRGTGLGLWLVQGIAMQLGGRIEYIDHNDKVEFQLCLPQ